MKRIRIGSGAGFADDRIAPAIELASRGDLDYLVFECLAERTIALAQRDKLHDPTTGYNEWLEERMRGVLAACVQRGTTIITNMGAANPQAGADVVAGVARELGLTGLTIAAITGDDVLDLVQGSGLPLLERGGTVNDLGTTIVAANAYLGSAAIVEALGLGADVIIVGRFADPALFLAPLVHEFGWGPEEWDLLAAGTAVGHLLECAAQVTGGYFADPGRKEVPDLAGLGFPLAEVAEDGSFVVTKVPGSGGRVTTATVTEQLLYEVHDPARYVTPDVVADFSGTCLEQRGADAVAVSGIRGTARPDTLKVSVGYRDGYIGEGQISYTGPNADARARLALDLVRDRLAASGPATTEIRFERIGVDAVHRGVGTVGGGDLAEVRIRVVARTMNLVDARRVGREVTALWLNGPAGGGGATRTASEIMAIASVLIPRERVVTAIALQEV
jgi:hypothetical protein